MLSSGTVLSAETPRAVRDLYYMMPICRHVCGQLDT